MANKTSVNTGGYSNSTNNQPLLKLNNSAQITDTNEKTNSAVTEANAKTNTKANAPVNVTAKPISSETYLNLLDDLMVVGERKRPLDNKVRIDGNLRYYYATNRGNAVWGKDTSTARIRVGFDAKMSQDWRLNGMVEGTKGLVNYSDGTSFRLNAVGKLGASLLRVGSFGYYMAEGNIYDSQFVGGRFDFGKPVKYTFSYGNTDYTQQTFVATARHDDLDYNIEAGLYNYQFNDTTQGYNTILTLGGNYKFSNFSLGAMILNASRKDLLGNGFGYVLSFNYGNIREYRPGTYNIWAKYYSQPQYTYIAPTMNGVGGQMQGFRGYGIGVDYTLVKNIILGTEYYDLTDIVTGEKGQTWWTHVSYYF